MKKKQPMISIMVVTYLGGERVNRCLTKIHETCMNLDFELLLVVNGSKAEQGLKSITLPSCHMLFPGINLGFSGGLAFAFQQAKGEFIVVVQDDVEVQPGWLHALSDTLQNYPELGSVGSVIFDLNGTPLMAGFILNPSCNIIENALDKVLSRPSDKPVRVELCNSATVAIRRTAWEEVGGPNRRLFPVGFIDYDLSMSMLTHGWGVAIDLRSRVHHEHRGSVKGNRKRQYVHYLNWRRWRRSWWRTLKTLPASIKQGDDIEAGLTRAATDPHPLVSSFSAASDWRYRCSKNRLVAEAVFNHILFRVKAVPFMLFYRTYYSIRRRWSA